MTKLNKELFTQHFGDYRPFTEEHAVSLASRLNFGPLMARLLESATDTDTDTDAADDAADDTEEF